MSNDRVAPEGGIRFQGKTYRQGDRLPKRYRRDQPEQRLRDPAAGSRFLPPNLGRPILPHVVTFSGMTGSLSKVYQPSDEALRHSVDNAHMMLLDPTVSGPLQARQMMTALLNWSVESEDDKDPVLKGAADELTDILRRTPRFTEYKRWLGEGIWYGRSAIQNQYAKWRGRDGKDRIVIGGWKPVSGDKLLFRYDDGSGRYEDGQLGVRVSRSTLHDDVITGSYELEATAQGMAYFLKGWERSKFAVHKHMIRDGEYEDITSGGSIHGVGLRSFLYWVWYQKQETMLQMVTLIERTGNGFTIYYYPEGNARAKAEVDDVARSQGHTNVIKLPHSSGDPDAYRIEQIPPNTAGLDALSDLVENHFGDMITRFILGQTLSTKAAATGLGSGVADLHKESLSDIVRYDAVNMEETLTKEVLLPLRDFNFPKLRTVEFRVRLSTDADAPEAQLAKIKQAWDMGAKIKATDIMDRIGLSVPKSDEPSVYNAQIVGAISQLENPAPMPMMGQPGQEPPDDPGNPAGGGGIPPKGPEGPDDGPGAPGGDDQPMPQSMDGKPQDVSKLYGPILYRREKLRYARNAKLREAIAAAVDATHLEPSDAQIDAGNAPKGKFWWNAWQVAIENPKGSTRKGWTIPLAAHYGYIRRTKSEADGDHLDAYIGPDPESEIVYVVDQVTKGGRFDEHKCLIGFASRREAVQAYLDCYPRDWKLGKVTALTVGQFRAWLAAGDTSKPIAPQVSRYAKRSKGTPAAGSFNFDEEKHPREDDGKFAPKGEGAPHSGAQQVDGKDFLTTKPEPPGHKKGDFTPAEKKKQTGFLLGQYDDPEQGLLFGDASKGEKEKPKEPKEERLAQDGANDSEGLPTTWENADRMERELVAGIGISRAEANDMAMPHSPETRKQFHATADSFQKKLAKVQARKAAVASGEYKPPAVRDEAAAKFTKGQKANFGGDLVGIVDYVKDGDVYGKWADDKDDDSYFLGKQDTATAIDEPIPADEPATSGDRDADRAAEPAATLPATGEPESEEDKIARWEAMKGLHPLEYGPKLQAMPKDEQAAYLKWDSERSRKASNKRRGEKAAKTRKFRDEQKAKRESTPEGKRSAAAAAKIDEMGHLYMSGAHYTDEDWRKAEAELEAANYAEQIANSYRDRDTDPVRQRRDRDAPQFTVDEGPDVTHAVRDPNTIPWSVKHVDGTEPEIITGGHIVDSVNVPGQRQLVLYGTPAGTGHKDWEAGHGFKGTPGGTLIAHFDAGDHDRSRRARRLLWQIANGRAQHGKTVADLQAIINGPESTKPRASYGDLVRTPDGVEGMMRGHREGGISNPRATVRHADGSSSYHDADKLEHVRPMSAEEQEAYGKKPEAEPKKPKKNTLGSDDAAPSLDPRLTPDQRSARHDEAISYLAKSRAGRPSTMHVALADIYMGTPDRAEAMKKAKKVFASDWHKEHVRVTVQSHIGDLYDRTAEENKPAAAGDAETKSFAQYASEKGIKDPGLEHGHLSPSGRVAERARTAMLARNVDEHRAYKAAEADYQDAIDRGEIIDPSGKFTKRETGHREKAENDAYIANAKARLKVIEEFGTGAKGKLKPSFQKEHDAITAELARRQGPQRNAKRRPPLRYAQRHAPKGGVSINGKQFTGGQFIPDGDYEQADPATKEAIDKAGDDVNRRMSAMPHGAKVKDPQGVEWTHTPKGTWQDAGGEVSNGRGYYPAGVLSRFGGDHAAVHKELDAWHEANKPAAPAGPEAPPAASPESPAEPTAAQRQSAKDALWSQEEVNRTQRMIDALLAQGAGSGQSPHDNDYIRRVKELKQHTAEMNEHIKASGATSPEHLQQLAGKTPPAPAAAPSTPPASPPTVTAPDPNAGSQDLAGTLAAMPPKTKVGKWTKGEGDKWVHEFGSVMSTPQMIGDMVKRGEGDTLNAAVTKQTTPGAGQPNPKGSKSPAPGGAQPSAPKGRIDPARMSTHDRANLATVASMFGINPGDAKNADRAANFALLAARKLGLDPQGADKTEQAAAATKYLAAQKPKLDALIDTATKLGYKGKAQTLVHRYRAAGEHIVKAATAAGYQGSGKYDKDDVMGALSHLSTVKAPSVTPGAPAGPPPPQPGQTLADRRAAAKATPGATPRPPSKFAPKPDGGDANPTVSQIIEALAAKVGGKMQLAAVAGVMAALWAAYAHQQRRQFFRQGTENGIKVIRYEE